MRLSEHQSYGLQGERWVLNQLTRLAKLHRARPGVYRQRWQFDLNRLPQLREDFIVVCVCDTSLDGSQFVTGQAEELYPFVIPGCLLNPMGRYHLQITSHPTRFKGWAAAYLGQWGVVGQMLARRQQQAGQLLLPLFTPLGHTAG